MPQERTNLASVVSGLPPGMLISSVPEAQISGIAIDSRRVQRGDLFVALRGATADGHAYVADAISRGAAAVAVENEPGILAGPYVRVRSTREALSWMAAAFYGWPGRRLRVIGITGTDGKTTTANLIHRILGEAGIRAGLISTVNAVIGEAELDTGLHVTTPDAHDVQDFMRRMVDAGLTHAVLETTSHGWAQHRIDACEFDVGVVTNITHEHLDEHGSYENYRAAKSRLFSSLAVTQPKPGGNPRLAVLNYDDSSYSFLVGIAGARQVSYGTASAADVAAQDIMPLETGSTFTAVNAGFRVDVITPLPGLYNVSNCLAALTATVLGADVLPETAARGIASTPQIPGRMEQISAGQDFIAVVDFAHTPNALKVALQAARSMVSKPSGSGRVIVVFGSAGLRDRAKRRMMAETAAELADLTVLTAEDPRTESLASILSDMAEGARSRGGREGATYWRVPDRGEAIRFAVSLARAEDLVVACGKGHEQSMCFGYQEHPWDDRTAMRAALSQRLGVPGPRMPYLPTQDKVEKDWIQSK
jgi:UDP-N-acetylmuramoyl-L-alanyl-D-glutamate--2,6-diaminopimelate ligase